MVLEQGEHWEVQGGGETRGYGPREGWGLSQEQWEILTTCVEWDSIVDKITEGVKSTWLGEERMQRLFTVIRGDLR